MNLLLTLAAFSAVPAAPIPAPPPGQEIQIAKSFELGSLSEHFNLVSSEYKFDQQRGAGTLTLKLEAKKEVDPALLRTCYAGFFDDDNVLQYTSTVRTTAFPLQKGERLMFTITTGVEDKKWNRIVVRKSDIPPTSTSPRPTAVELRGGGGFGGGGFPGGGGRGGTVPPPIDPNDR